MLLQLLLLLLLAPHSDRSTTSSAAAARLTMGVPPPPRRVDCVLLPIHAAGHQGWMEGCLGSATHLWRKTGGMQATLDHTLSNCQIV
jgi:hypothetical protein